MDYDSDYDVETSQSSQSSSGDATRLEMATILGEQFELPQGLAEDAEIFKEFFSVATWQSLNPSDRAHLQQFLPTFPENDAYEKNVTLRRLFNRENFKFGSPLVTFHNHLQNGHYRPDIAHLRYLMKKAERRQYKEQRKRHCFDLLKEVIVGRREVLEAAYNSPLGPIKIPRNYYSNNPAVDPVLQRVKKRYFQELAAVRSEVGEYSQSSEDENYQDGAPRTLSKKQRQKLSILESSLMSTDMTMVVSTMSTKPNGFDLESNVTITSNPYEVNEDQFKKMLLNHKRRRMNNEKHIELNTTGITLNDVAVRTQMGTKRLFSKPSTNGSGSHGYLEKQKKKSNGGSAQGQKTTKSAQDSFNQDLCQPPNVKKIKKEEAEMEGEKKSDESTDDEVSSTIMMSEPEKNIDVEYSSPTNIPQNQKLMEKQALEHIYEKQQKAGYVSANEVNSLLEMEESDSVNVSVPPEEKKLSDLKYRRTSQLVQDTHVSFFSLLRDIICSSPNHRMSLEKIENHLRAWESNPISPLNDWFTLVDESWTSLLESALSFLSADYSGKTEEFQSDDFVPYIEFKPHSQAYQWIGAGRDSDSHLLTLCSHWLDRKEDIYNTQGLDGIRRRRESFVEGLDDEHRDDPMEDYVPPPRCPTNWTVRLSTEEERKIFQEQESERFENPHKAFTYRMHGYESVVGPLKGIYNTQTSSSVLKPRGHNLLTLNRPSYVTILALVRDAAARLPNGEGTRSDICTLIRDSQYLDLSEAAENTLQSVVSGALDRLHYEVDACVKFDTRRKLWIYLHRRRSEEEMDPHIRQGRGAREAIRGVQRRPGYTQEILRDLLNPVTLQVSESPIPHDSRHPLAKSRLPSGVCNPADPPSQTGIRPRRFTRLSFSRPRSASSFCSITTSQKEENAPQRSSLSKIFDRMLVSDRSPVATSLRQLPHPIIRNKKTHQQYQGIAKTIKKAPRKKAVRKPDGNETKEKEGSTKEVSGEHKRKSKGKQNMVVQPMLKNVDSQIFQNSPGGESNSQEKALESGGESRVEEFITMRSPVLDDFMTLNCDSFKSTGNEAGLTMANAKPERVDAEQQQENSEAKMKGVTNKMPGQSLLNQELLSKNALAQTNNLRVLKAKQSKSGVLNLVSTGERLPQSDSQAVVSPVLKSDNRSQEILTSGGKKIIIQTSFAGGRTPVKFVTANANQIGRKLVTTKPTTTQVQRLTPSLTKVTANLPQQQVRAIGGQQQEGATIHGVVKTTPAAQIVQNPGLVATHVKGLSPGTQFLTTTGQKVQIIASSPQNLGQIQSIHLGSGQNILASNVQTATSNIAGPATNLIGNIQQVQLLTSAGQIITKALPTSNISDDKTSEGIKITSPSLKVTSAGGGGMTTIRNAITGQQLQMTIAKPTTGKSIKNVKMVACTSPSSDGNGKAMSLLTSSQQKPSTEKKDVKEQKIVVQKPGPQSAGKLGTQLLNVSSVQLLNPRTNQGQIQAITKPLINKSSTPILTGVKLVNTQQGVKMVATSSTVVQNAIQPPKTATHISKITSSVPPSSGSATKVQNRPTQIISMESLLQNAGQLRVASAGKGAASLIQIPSSGDGVPQFAVVSQGNIISVAGQPRVIQAQQINNMPQNQTTLATSTALNQSKTVTNKATGGQSGSGVRVGNAVNLATIAGKPMILASGTKTQAQHQNVILTSQGGGNNQAIVLTQGNVRAQSSPGTVTLVQQGTTQQILLPAGFQGGTINLKSLPGVKVIPFAGAAQKGRQQVYARIVKSGGQNSPQPGSESHTEEQ